MADAARGPRAVLQAQEERLCAALPLNGIAKAPRRVAPQPWRAVGRPHEGNECFQQGDEQLVGHIAGAAIGSGIRRCIAIPRLGVAPGCAARRVRLARRRVRISRGCRSCRYAHALLARLLQWEGTPVSHRARAGCQYCRGVGFVRDPDERAQLLGEKALRYNAPKNGVTPHLRE
eukprot:scaffold7381_cov132-Isochrysis_galbana.AAC.3